MEVTFAHRKTAGPVKTLIVNWHADDNGEARGQYRETISGFLIKAITDPGDVRYLGASSSSSEAGGPPNDDYDVVIRDELGLDVLANCADDLADRDLHDIEEVYFQIKADSTILGAHPAVNDRLTFEISNAGPRKRGKILLFWVPA